MLRVVVFVTSTNAATVITFDELSETASGSFFTAPYQGLMWSNFLALNGVLFPTVLSHSTNGFYYGVVSGSNIAVNGGEGGPAEIDSTGTTFDFLSVYLTGAQRSNLNIEIQGFRSGIQLYDTSVVASATSPTLFDFNYLNIDRLVFNSSGGQTAFFGGQESLVMDNFTFDLVPEPSTLLLAGFGALALCPFLKRRRT